jgi:hypothetical protein
MQPVTLPVTERTPMIVEETALACAFDALAPHEQRRERALLELLKSSTVAHTEVDDGYTLRIAGCAPTLAQLGDLIALERRCCPFLGFDLHCPPQADEFALRIWGPSAAKPFIRTTFVDGI